VALKMPDKHDVQCPLVDMFEINALFCNSHILIILNLDVD